MKKYAWLHTLVLIVILLGGSLTFWYGQGNVPLQLSVGLVTSIAYVAWGIIHHAIIGDLHRKVVIEYMLVGLIAVVLLITLAV